MEDIEKEFSVIYNIGLGSNKNLIIDICSDYFDFEKKELQQRNKNKDISNIEKIKRLKKDYLEKENKKESEKINSFKSFVHSSSYNSKLSFSNSKIN